MPSDIEGSIETQQIKNVVFATDFLPNSRLALDYAIAFAHGYNATLTITHILELPPEAQEVEIRLGRPSMSRERATARLEALASGARQVGIQTEIDLRVGNPQVAVLISATAKNADLLVLGTHGIYKGLEHTLIGSNAEKILLSARCPTLTVGTHALAGVELSLNFKRILLVSTFSQESIAAAEYAILLAQNLGTEIEILPVAPAETQDPQKVREMVETYCSALRPRMASVQEWCNVDFLLKRMLSAQALIERAAGCADELVILGVHDESTWKRHLRASFAFELVARSSSPVLSIHEG